MLKTVFMAVKVRLLGNRWEHFIMSFRVLVDHIHVESGLVESSWIVSSRVETSRVTSERMVFVRKTSQIYVHELRRRYKFVV